MAPSHPNVHILKSLMNPKPFSLRRVDPIKLVGAIHHRGQLVEFWTSEVKIHVRKSTGCRYATMLRNAGTTAVPVSEGLSISDLPSRGDEKRSNDHEMPRPINSTEGRCANTYSGVQRRPLPEDNHPVSSRVVSVRSSL